MKVQPALVPPAVAKWQFVEEKARTVLDAFCHREVRPPLLAPLAGLDAMGAFAHAYVAHMPWQTDPITRWYSMGPAFRSETGPFGWQQGHEIAAVVFGLASPSAEAELYAMAGTLLRECGLPAGQLRLTLTGGEAAATHDHQAALFAGLSDLGHVPHRAAGRHGGDHVGPEMEITLNRPGGAVPLLLCRGQRHDEVVAHLGGPATAAVGWSVDLGQVIAALTDSNAGYQAAISLLVAPQSAAARKVALPLSLRLRAAGFRTELEHRDLDADATLARAGALGARLVLLVPGPGGDGRLTLVDRSSGQREPIAADALEVRVAQLLD